MNTLRSHPTFLLLASLAFASACGESRQTEESVVEVTSITPSNVKSSFNGAVTIEGRGFNLGSIVLVDGTPATAYPGMTVTVVDPSTILLHIAYAGLGFEMVAGDRDIAVRVGLHRSEAATLHVRPILTTMEHVRTLPGTMTTSAGTMKLWVRPFAQGLQVRPGHELAGQFGLTAAAFKWENVRFTQAGGTPAPASVTGVSLVEFDAVNDTYPLSVTITIDQSGSMISGNPPSDPTDERINQSQAFVNRLAAQDQAEVLKFQGTTVSEVIDYTSDKIALNAALDSLRTGEGGATPLYDAALQSVNEMAAFPGANVVKAVIVLTDGKDTSSTSTPQQIIDAARLANIPVFPIGLGNPGDPASLDRAALQDIANQTGGLFFFAEDANALESVFVALNEVLASSYRVEVDYTLVTPLPAAGVWTVEADVMADVDGEQVRIPVPAFDASIVN